MTNEIKQIWKEIKCRHRWNFYAINGTDNESLRHWHIEECLACHKHREVMNTYGDACGYYD